MITPAEIRRKAENLYDDYRVAWLAGDEFFLRSTPANRRLDSDDAAAAIAAIRELREGSQEVRGFGYAVEWREHRSRTFGRHPFPERIYFETPADLLRLIGKQREFATFATAVERLHGDFPELETWPCSHRAALATVVAELGGLLHVLRYFREPPRPERFVQELPLPVDSKFVERHASVLRDWFDVVLPPATIRAEETHFERRYGLRYAEQHVLVRFLDDELRSAAHCPWSESSLPWLAKVPLTYWGDLDVEGFLILSEVRSQFPQTRSVLRDERAVKRFLHLAVPGNGGQPAAPPRLTEKERRAFEICRDENLRIAQERLPHDASRFVQFRKRGGTEARKSRRQRTSIRRPQTSLLARRVTKSTRTGIFRVDKARAMSPPSGATSLPVFPAASAGLRPAARRILRPRAGKSCSRSFRNDTRNGASAPGERLRARSQLTRARLDSTLRRVLPRRGHFAFCISNYSLLIRLSAFRTLLPAVGGLTPSRSPAG